MDIEVGDTVKLKSGGPLMTVAAIGNGNATCIWFEDNKRCDGNFNLATLVKDDGP